MSDVGTSIPNSNVLPCTATPAFVLILTPVQAFVVLVANNTIAIATIIALNKFFFMLLNFIPLREVNKLFLYYMQISLISEGKSLR